MFLLIRYYVVVISGYLLFTSVSSDVLEDERASFFGLTHEIQLSGTTMELIEQLELAVWHHGRGDRRVRRYFDNYEAPFVAQKRRRMAAINEADFVPAENTEYRMGHGAAENAEYRMRPGGDFV